MLTNIKHIPTSEVSRPFAEAAKVCDFDSLGYVEDEYFQYGTANVYTEDSKHKVSVINSDVPYCTRLLVRRPADISKFSGNVVIEILNASANFDIDRMWINSWPFFTRNGDIYVGITSKGHVIDTLKTWDPDRYADINWNNPTPEREKPESFGMHFLWLPQYETGLFWDMMIDTIKLFRSTDAKNPLLPYGKCWFYLTGWSQSTSYLNRIVSSFSYLPENCADGPLFDGYLNGGGGAGLAPINQYEPTPFGSSEMVSSVLGASEPFMAINTESENRSSLWYGDFDEPEFKFRTWQIAGTSHDSLYNLVDYYDRSMLEKLHDMGKYDFYDGVEGEPMNNPYEPVFSAGWNALYSWVRNGVPAPHAPKIEIGVGKEFIGFGLFGSRVYNKTDVMGNALGGIRLPSQNYATGRYYHTSTGKNGNIIGAFGYCVPFAPEVLKGMYGDLEHYQALLEKDYTRAVSEGFLLEGDRKAYIEHCMACAKKRGL